MSFIDNLKEKFNFALGQSTEQKFLFENPFKLGVEEKPYTLDCLKSLYSKMLKDCYNHASSIDDEIKPLFWDTIVKSAGKSNAGLGLISLLAKAMAEKAELFLMYKKGVLREATTQEQEEIKKAFKDGNKHVDGHWLSLSNFDLTTILNILFQFQFIIMSSTYTGINISKALQLKISKLRETYANSDSISAIKQAGEVIKGLKDGKSVLLDLLDKIETSKIDMSSTETAIKFINGLLAYYLNMPLSYINGQLTTGISTTGESDNIAVERGLEALFNSVFKPATDDVFNINTMFISENWRVLLSSGEVLKTIEMLSDEIVPLAVKQRVAEAVLKDFYTDEDKLSPSTEAKK